MKKSFFRRIFLFSFLFLLFFFPAFSQFYADISIDVNNAGDVSILGKTNYENFLNITNNPSYTSKKGGVWTLNISSAKNEIFDDFIFELTLPSNAQINYMKTTPNFRIENVGDRIKIIGIGTNKPFTILIQYKINKIEIFSPQNVLYLLIGISFLVILGIIIYFGRRLLKKETRIENLDEEIEEALESSDLLHPDVKIKNKKYDLDSFSDRQKMIIQLLKEKGGLTQDEIGDIMKIPKSSLSRNIKALEIKKIVTITSYGRYNKIILNKKRLEVEG